MSALIDIQEAGDIVYTMDLAGVLHAWKVQEDGGLVEVAPIDAVTGRLDP